MERKTEVWLIAIFLIVIVVAVIGAAFVSSKISPAQSSFNATNTSAITSTDHGKGNAAAKVTVIEYGDFQCPACGQYEPIMQQLEKEYSDRVLFVFRHFPLYQVHQNAMISSQATEAAAQQGKFWEMHDILYAKQSEWSNTATDAVVSKNFDGYAKNLGLDVSKFDADINSAAVKARVQKDMDLATAAQVDHTPTFFINLRQVRNPSSYADFKSVLDAALDSSTSAQ